MCVWAEAFEAVDHGHKCGWKRKGGERERETELVQGMKGWAPSPVLSVAIK